MREADIFHITADIERVETSITIAGRRLAVRAALILVVGVLLSLGLASALAPALGTPVLFIPLGLAPLYLAGMVAFVRAPDGRHWERNVIDRYRFMRLVKRAVNLEDGTQLEHTKKVIDLRKEVFPVVDLSQSDEAISREVRDIDLPLTLEGAAEGFELSVDGLVLTIQPAPTANRIRVTMRRQGRRDAPA